MLHEKLKTIRISNKLTQKDVADYLKISRSTYNNYEQNIAEPSIESLIKLADKFHTSIDELVGRDTDMINLNTLEPEVSTLIRKIIKMNDIQKAQTINFVGALTMFDN